MFELGIRLASGLIAFGAAWWLRLPQAELIGKVVAIFSAYSVFTYQLTLRKVRSANVSTVIACLDAFAIAFVCAAAGRIGQLGFLTLAPIAYAAAAHGSLPALMAPIAATAVLSADLYFSKTGSPSFMTLVQATGILLTGLLMNHRRIVVTVAQPVLPEVIQPLATAEPDGTLELRESFRKLKEMYADLETKSDADRFMVEVMELRSVEGKRLIKHMALKLRDLTSADGIALYTIAQFEDRMVVRSYSGNYPAEVRDASLSVDLRQAVKSISDQAALTLRSMVNSSDAAKISNVVLRVAGRVVGMVAIADARPAFLKESVRLIESASEFLAQLILDEQKIEANERRMRDAELLYELATCSAGAKTPNNLAARVISDLSESLDVDQIAIYWIDEGEDIAAVQKGISGKFLDIMRFSAGQGLEGWLNLGAPEVWIPATQEDSRVPGQEALKLRIGSYALLPLQFSDEPFGYICVATNRSAGLDVSDIETLRAVSSELSQALARLRGEDILASGIATAPEFQAAVEAGHGHLVHLQPIRRDNLIEQYGQPALERALRHLVRKLRAKLPAGSLIYRRPDGDFLAYLRGVSPEFAVSWANEVSAIASMIGVADAKGNRRMPLPMRAKVATQVMKSEVA